MKTLGRFLKKIRIEKKLSQIEVARRMGFANNGYIAQVEKGMYSPEGKTLSRYAKALEISLKEIKNLKQKAQLEEIGVKEENIFPEVIRIPILGSVPCGNPSEAILETDEYFPLPADDKIARRKDIFALRADGLSMIEANIRTGDLIIIDPHAQVANKDVIVAGIEEEFTLKYYYERGGYVELMPANKDFKPIRTKDPSFRVVGKVVRRISVEEY